MNFIVTNNFSLFIQKMNTRFIRGVLTSSFFLALLFIVPNQGFAAVATPCTTDITEGFPLEKNPDAPWDNAYIIPPAYVGGPAYQRAIMTEKMDNLTLREGDMVEFEGTGDPNGDIYVFIFSEDRDANGNLKKPDLATCYSAGKADEKGFFKMEIHSNLLWDAFAFGDQKMIVDSFTTMTDNWEQQYREWENQNFFVGTHMLPKEIDIKVEAKKPEGCRYLCDDDNNSQWGRLQLAYTGDPSKYSPRIVNDNFDGIITPGGNTDFALVRLQHNFYSGVKGGEIPPDDELIDVAFKTTMMEMLKQVLVDYQVYPEDLGGLTKNTGALESVSARELKMAADGAFAYDEDKQAIAKAIKTALTSPVDDPDRKAALTLIAEETAKGMGSCVENQTSGNFGYGNHGCLIPTADIFHEIFPPKPPPTWTKDWSSDAEKLFLLWTEYVTPNECILPKEESRQAFDDKFGTNFWVNGHHHEKGRMCGWDLKYATGFSSPAILLNIPSQVSLTPNFTEGLQITYVSEKFNEKTDSWNLSAGQKFPIFYRYRSSNLITENFSSISCLTGNDLGEYADFLSQELQLSPAERELIIAEIGAQLPDSDSYYQFGIADPKDIAEHFSWKINGAHANLGQLFFDINKDACAQTLFTPLSNDVKTSFLSDRDGFEVGEIKN